MTKGKKDKKNLDKKDILAKIPKIKSSKNY